MLASVAATAGSASGIAGLVDGFGTGLLLASGVAVAVALVAAFAVPSVRPQPGMAHGMH